MDLHPCDRCRRHVATGTSCPFCGASPRAPIARAVKHASKLSRAAVFAGAAACYTSTPPPKQTQLQHQHQQQQDPPPPDDGIGVGGGFAKPPGTPVGTASVRGQVIGPSGQPTANVTVHAQLDGPIVDTVTDAQGRFSFDQLAAGDWRFFLDPIDDDNTAQPAVRVQVQAGAVHQATIYIPNVKVRVRNHHGPCCKPYGAPPARRRVV